MTRRKRTGPAGKRLKERSSGIPLFDDRGGWIGKFNMDTATILTPSGQHSQPGTKAHNLRVTMALKWIAENRPELIAQATDQEEISEDSQ